MLVRPAIRTSCLPAAVSQRIVGVSEPPVTILLPSSLKLRKESAMFSFWLARLPLFGTLISATCRPVETSHNLTLYFSEKPTSRPSRLILIRLYSLAVGPSSFSVTLLPTSHSLRRLLTIATTIRLPEGVLTTSVLLLW